MTKLVSVRDSGPVLGQRIASAVVKAGLNSIPLAALAWDVAAACLEFFNDRSAEDFIDELGDKVSALENHSGTLSPPAQAAAHEALQRLMHEDSEYYARELANAVIAIETSDEDPRILRQVAVALTTMNSRLRVYLGVIYRWQNQRLEPTEREIVAKAEPTPAGTFGDSETYDILRVLEHLLDAHYPSASIESDLAALQAAGLARLPGVRLIAAKTDEPWINTPVTLTPLGEIVLRAFTEDPAAIPPFSDLCAGNP
ncbi:MAG: hypothetical protein QOJ91_1555 [Sphingomonadales bacterium]|jgi:hypothetical protein|nr:hypothetical protein [Sphingomonadales bacterium]